MPRTLQLLAWIGFLGWLTVSGQASQYVVWWQVWLIGGSAVILLLGAGMRYWDTHVHHDHDHTTPGWSEMGVHILPGFLFAAVGPTVLGSHALSSTDSFTGGVSAMPTAPPSVDADGYRRTDLLARRHDPFLEGGKISVVARVGELTEQTRRRRRNSPPPDPKPVLFRHVISCCAADGRPIYAWIDPSTPIDTAIDTWVELRGTVNVRETGGVVPVISVTDWHTIPTPAEPYLILPGTVPAPGKHEPTP